MEATEKQMYRGFTIWIHSRRPGTWIAERNDAAFPIHAQSRTDLEAIIDRILAEDAFTAAHGGIGPAMVLKEREPRHVLCSHIGGGRPEEFELPERVDEALYAAWLNASTSAAAAEARHFDAE